MIEYAPEITLSPQELRQKVLLAQQNGLYFDIYMDPNRALGDRFIQWASYAHIMSLLTRDDPHPPKLRAYSECNPYKNEGGFRLSYACRMLDDRIHVCDEIQPKRIGIYMKLLMRFGQLLDFDIPYDELRRVPLPRQANFGPFSNFCPGETVHMAQEIRRHSKAGQERVVIVQGGSKGVKRFNDDQVRQIISAAQRRWSDPSVVVITDKEGLRQRIEYNNGADDVDLAFPVDDHDFINSLDHVDFPKASTTVMAERNIVETGAFLAAADHILTTDTFLMWFGAGCKGLMPDRNGFLRPGDVTAIFTVGHPETWTPHGVNAVASSYWSVPDHSEAGWSNGAIETYEYRRWHNFQFPEIAPCDMDQFLNQIREIS